jgi:hypothetical protein
MFIYWLGFDRKSHHRWDGICPHRQAMTPEEKWMVGGRFVPIIVNWSNSRWLRLPITRELRSTYTVSCVSGREKISIFDHDP